MLKLCKEIVVFLFIAKLLENFGVSERYGKFVKLLISLIVVLKLITPVFSFFDSEFDFSKLALEMEKRLVVESETAVFREEVKEIETVQMSEIQIKVEDIEWKK